MVSCLACIKTDVEAHGTLQNCGSVHSIDRKKLYQLILQEEFVQNRASDPMFILGEMIFQITGCTSYNKNDSVVLIKLLKLIYG